MIEESVRVAAARFFTLSLAAGALIGCTYLHYPERQAVAEKLQQDLKTYSQHSPEAYQTMRANLNKFAVQEDAILTQFGQNLAEAEINNFLGMSDENLTNELGTAKNKVVALQEEIRLETSDYLNRANLAKKEIASLDVAIAKMKTSFQEASSDVEKWNETVALLKTAAANLPSAKGAGKSDKSTTDDALKHLGDSLSKIGNEQVQFEDANGKPQKKTIAAIVQETLTEKDNIGATFRKAPGIKLRILTLGLDVAETERERALMRLNRIHDRMSLFEDFYKESLLAQQLLHWAELRKPPALAGQPSIATYIDANAVDARNQRDIFLQTVKPKPSADTGAAKPVSPVDTEPEAPVDPKAAKPKTPLKAHDDYEKALFANADLFETLRLLIIAEAIIQRDEARLPVMTARLNHLESIGISEYNDRIWQLYLQAGADGLVAYQKGGFSEADAAQIVRIAEAVAVGIIALNGAGGL
jgi:hypothetical protein